MFSSGRYHQVDHPEVGESPVVVEVPHAGLLMDPVSMATCTASISAIARDADLYVDELVDECLAEGATVLRASASRYMIDLNRDDDDFDPRAVDGGKAQDRPFGLIWRQTTDGGRALCYPLSTSELQRRLDLVYRPYHKSLTDIIEHKRRRFGRAVVLSAHSMPTVSFHKQSPQPSPRCPDVVVGSRFGRTATCAIVRAAENHARAYGWTVQRDEPFAGGATTVRHGHPERGEDAIQVEIARRMYMNERTLAKKPGSFRSVTSFWRGLAAKLAETVRS